MFSVSQDTANPATENLKQSPFAKRLLAGLLSLCLLMTGLQVSVAQGAMVSTQDLASGAGQQESSATRKQLLLRLQQADAQQAMRQLGVDPAKLKERVSAMTNSELARFNSQIQDMPSGGDSIFAVVLFILLILIVLDLLGATNIFPAVHPIGTYKK